jgi:hypothetical protein
MSVPEITLFCHTRCEQAVALRGELEERGYVVRVIGSGRRTPVVRYGKTLLVGHLEIMLYLCTGE